MQVAEILSDLTSLRVCDHTDALALVTVNERLPARSPSQAQEEKEAQRAQNRRNEDLRRAKELVDLHHELKTRHAHGTVDEELARARESVRKVLREVSYGGEGTGNWEWSL